MNGRFSLTQRAARGVVAAGAVLLMGGATWHGWAADNGGVVPQPVLHAATAQSPTARAVAGSRDSYADIVDVVSPAVVTVHAEGRARVSPTQFQLPDDEFFAPFFRNPGQRQMPVPRQRQSAMGSGVVVTTDGYILTNNHVIEGADNVSVDFTDGRTLSAKVIGTDEPSDLALLKVTAANLKAIALGDSNAVHVGDVVLAVGNPLNVGQTVTMGIISAKGRTNPGGAGNGGYEDFLQTDAPINRGNSGGALVNTKGELIGINSQILSNGGGNIGIGFAIPANMARRVMDDLRTSGKVTRGQLGVGVQEISADMAASLGLKDTDGVIVTSVTAGGAAERAGLRRGDVIRSLNGQPVSDVNTLRNRIAEAGPGAAAELVIVRDNAEKHVTAKLEEVNAKRAAQGGDSGERDAERESDKTALGVSVAPLTPELASRVGVPRDTQGLVVQDVDPEGRARNAGIREGDVIQEVNRQPVKSVDDLRAALRRTNDRPALLLIHRQGADIFVAVKPANN